MNRLGGLVVHRPWLVIISTLFITGLLAGVIAFRGIQFNGSLETLTRKDSDLEFYNKIRSVFGDDSIIVVALTTSDVFTPDFMKRFADLTNRIKAVPGVDDVQSLTNVKSISRTQNQIEVDDLIKPGATLQDLQQLKPSVVNDPLYAKNYVSRDGKTASINVFLKAGDSNAMHQVADKVASVAEAGAGGDQLIVTGVPVIESRAIRFMSRDMALISPIAGLLCASIFFFAFRNFWAAAIPMFAIVAGLIWVLGLMSLFGRPVTMATLPLPTILMAVGGSYMFHVLNQRRLSAGECAKSVTAATQSASEPSKHEHKIAWLSGLKFIMPAVFVSGLTTIAGFAALTSSSIPTARDMGAFNAVGVTVMLGLALFFVPALLTVAPIHAFGSRKKGSDGEYAKPVDRMLKHVTAAVLYRRPHVWIVFLAGFAVLLFGIKKLEVNTDYLAIFPKSSQTVHDTELLHERLAGAATVKVVVSGAPGAIYDSTFLKTLDNLAQFARTQPGVDSVISVADIVKRINTVVSTDRVEAIPTQPDRIKSIFDDFLVNEPTIGKLVNLGNGGNGSEAVVVLRTDLTSSSELRVLTHNIDKWSRNNLPNGLTARATGSVVLLDSASDAVAKSQISSLVLALIGIYAMMALLFRSFMCGLLALIPNLLPVIGYFGFLGWFSIPLDITTSLVATSALGLAVDNAVHLLRRYRQCACEGHTRGWLMWLTLVRSGKPIFLANLTLVAAFLIFMVSKFVPVRMAGLLWAVTIAGCLIADLVFLPVLIKTGWFEKSAVGPAMKSGLHGGRADAGI